MQEIVNEFLSPERIREFGILDETEVNDLLNKFLVQSLMPQKSTIGCNNQSSFKCSDLI